MVMAGMAPADVDEAKQGIARLRQVYTGHGARQFLLAEIVCGREPTCLVGSGNESRGD
jgi:hypothetical protein